MRPDLEIKGPDGEVLYTHFDLVHRVGELRAPSIRPPPRRFAWRLVIGDLGINAIGWALELDMWWHSEPQDEEGWDCDRLDHYWREVAA